MQFRECQAQVQVVLYDFQLRKFQPRAPHEGEELDEDLTEIEKAILNQKTRLAASLARRRIKHSAPNIEYLLPDAMRNVGNAQMQLPSYCWVNTIKITWVHWGFLENFGK